MFHLCPNERLARLLYSDEKGEKHLMKKFDMAKIVDKVQKLQKKSKNKAYKKNEINIDEDCCEVLNLKNIKRTLTGKSLHAC